ILLRGCLAVHAADPSALCVGPALGGGFAGLGSSPSDDPVPWLQARLAAMEQSRKLLNDPRIRFDVVSIHYYNSLRGFAGYVSRVRSAIQKTMANPNTPIWVTELGGGQPWGRNY